MTQTALITGATSGFGAAAARRFANAGWKVVATGRRAVTSQRQQSPQRARLTPCLVTLAAAARATAAAAARGAAAPSG